MQIGRLVGDVGAAVHQYRGGDAVHFQVVGLDDAAVDAGVGGDAVEGQAFGEDIVEIEFQQMRQRLQAEHAEQLGRARVLFQELALFHVHDDLAGQAGDVQRIRQALPRDVAAQLALAVAQRAGEAEAVEQLDGVGDVEQEMVAVVVRADLAGGPFAVPVSVPSALASDSLLTRHSREAVISALLACRSSRPSCLLNSSKRSATMSSAGMVGAALLASSKSLTSLAADSGMISDDSRAVSLPTPCPVGASFHVT